VLNSFCQDKLSPVPIIKPVDPVDREVNYMPTKAPYDPRWMLAGRQSPSTCNDFCEVYCFLYLHVENLLVMFCHCPSAYTINFDFFATSSNYVTFVLSFCFASGSYVYIPFDIRSAFCSLLMVNLHVHMCICMYVCTCVCVHMCRCVSVCA